MNLRTKLLCCILGFLLLLLLVLLKTRTPPQPEPAKVVWNTPAWESSQQQETPQEMKVIKEKVDQLHRITQEMTKTADSIGRRLEERKSSIPPIEPLASHITVFTTSDASIFIDGLRTEAGGTTREYWTPKLKPGVYTYTFVARFPNGVRLERKVSFAAGDHKTFSFYP